MVVGLMIFVHTMSFVVSSLQQHLQHRHSHQLVLQLRSRQPRNLLLQKIQLMICHSKKRKYFRFMFYSLREVILEGYSFIYV